jgi:5'-methylthioadenosine phosphorylase
MTLVPEVFLAKELEICCAALCYVTNYAEGVKDKKFQPGVLFEGLADEEEQRLVEKSVAAFPIIMETIANFVAEENAAAKPSECNCAHLMQRYRDRGDIGDDWHEWILP